MKRSSRNSLVLLAGLIALAAVGCRSKSTLNGRLDGRDVPMEIKSAGVQYGVMKVGNIGKQAFAHEIYIANYEMDTSSGATMSKPLTAAGQLRVKLKLSGPQDTFANTPFRIGSYTIRSSVLESVQAASVYTFVDGKEVERDLGLFVDRSNVKGDVAISKVTADSISGKINLTSDDDKKIWGYFTAKAPTRVL